MGHLYHGYVSHNQRVLQLGNPMFFLANSPSGGTEPPLTPPGPPGTPAPSHASGSRINVWEGTFETGSVRTGDPSKMVGWVWRKLRIWPWHTMTTLGIYPTWCQKCHMAQAGSHGPAKYVGDFPSDRNLESVRGFSSQPSDWWHQRVIKDWLDWFEEAMTSVWLRNKINWWGNYDDLCGRPKWDELIDLTGRLGLNGNWLSKNEVWGSNHQEKNWFDEQWCFHHDKLGMNFDYQKWRKDSDSIKHNVYSSLATKNHRIDFKTFQGETLSFATK